MKPDEGYTEARKLLKEKYGQDYRIATAYVNRVTEATPIKSEDGIALQTFSVLLISCRNTLKEIGYLNRIENPDCLIKIIEKLPFSLRQKWREVADDITNNKSREITFDDIVKFVEGRVRVMNHPIFGKLTTSKSKDQQEPKGRYSFGIDASSESKGRDPRAESKPHKCPPCSGNHILPRCNRFQKESVEERIKFARKGGLCFNCLFQGHIARSCPKNSFCKVTGCELKHSTYLHPKPNTSVADKSCGPDASCVPLDSRQSSSSDAFQQSLKNATNAQIDVTGAGVSTVGLPLVPVKVKCAQSLEVVSTYAFLDSGSNTTFCTTELLQCLGVQGRETALSLTTLHQEDHIIKTSVISLEVFDLEENDMVELPTVFSTE